MAQMSITDEYVRIMGLFPLKREWSAAYDIKRNRTGIRKGECYFIERLVFDRGVLLPQLTESVRRPFYKGMD